MSLVLDWFHAAERVSDLAKLAFHEDANPERSKVTKSLKDALWNGLLDEFFAGLSQLCAPADLIQEGIDYFHKRRPILRYKECRDRKLPIGSGVIEGDIRFLGKDRLDRSGMRWNIGGADHSGRLDEFYKKR
ncbi:hypothetical protein IV102_09940, partial [bacterium]|nr:hypothetical protein [bacterium]